MGKKNNNNNSRNRGLSQSGTSPTTTATPTETTSVGQVEHDDEMLNPTTKEDSSSLPPESITTTANEAANFEQQQQQQQQENDVLPSSPAAEKVAEVTVEEVVVVTESPPRTTAAAANATPAEAPTQPELHQKESHPNNSPPLSPNVSDESTKSEVVDDKAAPPPPPPTAASHPPSSHTQRPPPLIVPSPAVVVDSTTTTALPNNKVANNKSAASSTAASKPQPQAGASSVGKKKQQQQDSGVVDSVPYGRVLGVGPYGTAVLSNGSDEHFSGEASVAYDLRLPHSFTFRKCFFSDPSTHAIVQQSSPHKGSELVRQLRHVGVRWQCVEFARRSLLMSKAVWLRSVPIAENIWQLDHVLSLATGRNVGLTKYRADGSCRYTTLPSAADGGMAEESASNRSPPQRGDLVIWRRSGEMPFGHVAVVASIVVVDVPKQQQQGSASLSPHVMGTLPEGAVVVHAAAAMHLVPDALQPGRLPNSSSIRQYYVLVAEQNHVFQHLDKFEQICEQPLNLPIPAEGNRYLPLRLEEVEVSPTPTTNHSIVSSNGISKDDAHRRSFVRQSTTVRDATPQPQKTFSVILEDEDPLLGWMRVEQADVTYQDHDIPDNFRIPTHPRGGRIERFTVPRDPTLRWLRPSSDNACDFFLKRSLVIDGNVGEGAVAAPHDVPDGYYVLDGSIWARIRRAAHTLHDLALHATWVVTQLYQVDPRLGRFVLEHQFGIPSELHWLVRRSLRETPAMCGRFDFGFDGRRITLMEYNCDSSAALYECADTQQKWAQAYGIGELGHSSGSFLTARLVEFWKAVLANPKLCPPNKLIHFMVDDDDEERYTALCVAKAAQEVGFRVKLCVKLFDFRFVQRTMPQPLARAVDDDRIGCHDDREECYLGHYDIEDLDHERVYLVWKTWSWDTILHQFVVQRDERQRTGQAHATTTSSRGSAADENDAIATSSPSSNSSSLPRPTLSDICCNPRINVLEPMWKAITGSKAILPFMYDLQPDHPNMVYASFQQTDELLRKGYVSKPVNGRAGQNITMSSAIADEGERALAVATYHEKLSREGLLGPQLAVQQAVRAMAACTPGKAPSFSAPCQQQGGTTISPSVAVPAIGGSSLSTPQNVPRSVLGDPNSAAGSASAFATSSFLDETQRNEVSGGRFFNSLMVYQEKIRLKPYPREVPAVSNHNNDTTDSHADPQQQQSSTERSSTPTSYFPIFCGWMIGEQFSGVVVREDTSKITKLGSLVAPCRVLRY